VNDRDLRNIEAVRQFYQAERSVAAPDIVWHVPGHNPVSGTYHGQHEYFDLLPSRMAPLDEWDVDVEDVLINEDMAVTTVRVRGERMGRKIDLHGHHVIRLNPDGQVEEGWGFTSHQDTLDGFFAP
jgi:ketosteroid isomerase-like protein